MTERIETLLTHEAMQSFWKVQFREDLAGTVAFTMDGESWEATTNAHAAIAVRRAKDAITTLVPDVAPTISSGIRRMLVEAAGKPARRISLARLRAFFMPFGDLFQEVYRVDCSRCNGDGYSMCGACGHAEECGRCGGSGFLPAAQTPENLSYEYVKRDDNKQVDFLGVRVWPQLVGHMLHAFDGDELVHVVVPDASQVGHSVGTPPIVFRGDGWAAIVMPQIPSRIPVATFDESHLRLVADSAETH